MDETKPQMVRIIETLPTEIEVGGIHYDVQVSDNVILDGKVFDGHIGYNEALISIHSAQTEQMKIVTLFHEIIHACLTQTGRGDALSEEIIDTIAYELAGLRVRIE
jgi:hypothetical protein